MVSEKNCKLKDKQTGRLTDGQIDEQMRVKQYTPPPPLTQHQRFKKEKRHLNLLRSLMKTTKTIVFKTIIALYYRSWF